MLKEIFISLCEKYTEDYAYIDDLWKAIYNQHTGKKRHYHNLNHLEHLYQNLVIVKPQIQDWDIILFALFYHDYTYNVLKKDNEEKSAIEAEKALQKLILDPSKIKLCSQIILATKTHDTHENKDINYFTDADLGILGSSWINYKNYYLNVRKEYSFYPNFIYKKGRLKVVQHFLNMSRVYKTSYFFDRYEGNAKENLKKELAELQSSF